MKKHGTDPRDPNNVGQYLEFLAAVMACLPRNLDKEFMQHYAEGHHEELREQV